jgi:hypothetical protein
MNKCCEKCALHKVNDHVGRCSWAPTKPPFWFVAWPTLVEADEGADCLAFVPVKGASCKKKPV